MKTSLVVLLSGLVGFAFGASLLGFAALWIGISFLGHVQGDIHSDWTLLVFLGALLCFGVGGAAGAKAAVRLARSRV
ncbi:MULTISPECIES: hypothetical protein [unclassified Bradyrhizobium]|uniref:hypothetical protein n=1 Tax=unclassified Bradyrhizobium TaxID=2631580 RepID=UPI001FF2318D|nr:MULTISPECIES: hypothetical protein [unclassified Bradyrhizobium]MCJ9701053.1 hypothetical protein [Bradyrhizobium sp. SHOUNA76]MCJ9733260.1 hypothetical protein [Bradyrhizobium sp. PRIMUS42]